MDRHEIEGHEVIEGEGSRPGTAHTFLVPKRWRGADVKIVRTSDPDE